MLDDPAELRRLPAEALPDLAHHIRSFLVETVLSSGGHLGPNLGVVELTLALHRVFDSPRDAILFDTGHQSYVHKMVTGRAHRFGTLRQEGGLSGYPSPAESVHDWQESSHASAALSFAHGLAVAARRHGSGRHVVAVVGDGALTGGMCWEALNNLGADPELPVVVVLNDNGHTYSPTVGGLADHLGLLRSGALDGASVFESLGLGYVGPVDGHDVPALETALRWARELAGPVVLHVTTRKGAGYGPAEAHDERLHQVPPAGTVVRGPTWNEVFAAELEDLASEHPDVLALTAGMPGPTGLSRFARRFPDRCLDVGIAEQHAVTAASGMAAGGLHPVVAVYATFLNRAVDQLLMDVALAGASVTFAVQRAGVTGDDGPSHHGVWDLALAGMVPGLWVAAPRDAEVLRQALRCAVGRRDGPVIIRFPKGDPPLRVEPVRTVGVVDVLREHGNEAIVVSVGAMAPTAIEAARVLAGDGLRVTVVDPRWPLPVPDELVEVVAGFPVACVVEDGVRAGGVGSALAARLRDARAPTEVRDLALPRRFLAHGRRDDVLAAAELDAGGVARAVRAAVASTRP